MTRRFLSGPRVGGWRHHRPVKALGGDASPMKLQTEEAEEPPSRPQAAHQLLPNPHRPINASRARRGRQASARVSPCSAHAPSASPSAPRRGPSASATSRKSTRPSGTTGAGRPEAASARSKSCRASSSCRTTSATPSPAIRARCRSASRPITRASCRARTRWSRSAAPISPSAANI